MEGVIILDEKQYMFKDVAAISIVQSDKNFTIRIETATNQFNENSDEDAILNALMNEDVEKTFVLPPSHKVPVELTQAPVMVHADAPKMAKSTIRMSIEKPDGKQVPDLNPLVLSAAATDEPKAPVISMSNQPTAKGIIVSEQPVVTGGQRFPLGNDAAAILRQTRNDLGIVVIGDKKREVLKNVKKNIVLKSEVFTQLSDASVRLALQTLVMKEQLNAHVYDYENYVFIEEPTQLVVVAIINEQQGLGEFYYEEMVSVYEGISTRTKVDNGKDDK